MSLSSDKPVRRTRSKRASVSEPLMELPATTPRRRFRDGQAPPTPLSPGNLGPISSSNPANPANPTTPVTPTKPSLRSSAPEDPFVEKPVAGPKEPKRRRINDVATSGKNSGAPQFKLFTLTQSEDGSDSEPSVVDPRLLPPSPQATPEKPKRTAQLLRHSDYPDEPQTPTKPRRAAQSSPEPLRVNSVFTTAKAAFQRGSKCTAYYGREAERAKLLEFLNSKLAGVTSSGTPEGNSDKSSGSAGALYISGPPGTGKTAMLHQLISETLQPSSQPGRYTLLRHNSNSIPDIAYAEVNCMVVAQPSQIFDEIYSALSRGTARLPGKRGIAELASAMFEKKRGNPGVCLLVLDELDHLITRDQQVLFELFSWAFKPNSNLVLIGIANALDLTDRFLPRLKANNLSPAVVPFLPYTAGEIAAIIRARLNSLASENAESSAAKPAVPPLIHPAAIMLCAKKTATNTGDLRKAFDICRRAIELVEQSLRAKAGLEDPPMLNYTFDTAPKVMISHMAKVCAQSFGQSALTRLKTLTVLQKAVLATLLQAETATGDGKATLTVQKLYDYYCKAGSPLGQLKLNEYLEVVNVLESAGLINVAGIYGRRSMGSTSQGGRQSKGGGGASAGSNPFHGVGQDYGQRKISANVTRADMATASEGVELLKGLLE